MSPASSSRSGDTQAAVNAASSNNSSPPVTRFAHLRRALSSPVDALPLDIFRVLIGILSFSYFARTALEATDFSAANGLLDHELSFAIFPFTRLGLFHPGVPLSVLQALFVLACVASLAVVAGYRIRTMAAVLYVIAVSTYRWNFLVMYVDDVVMHLMLLWLVLLPLGTTLSWSDWKRNEARAPTHWLIKKVPGTAARCFLWNLMLIYLVAGLWKWTSPMWRDGTAVYAVLQMPVARAPELLRPEHLPLLRIVTWGALLLETLMPIVFFLPRRHPLKQVLMISLLMFHVGMILALRIPFANFACLAATTVLFSDEIMSWLRRRQPASESPAVVTPFSVADYAAVAVVVTLTCAMVSSITIPRWRTPPREREASLDTDMTAMDGLRPLQRLFFEPLWLGGLAQQYQLFNWIDDRNFAVRYEIHHDGLAANVDPALLFPPSARGSVVQAYLHGISWMQIPRPMQQKLRESISIRAANRLCRALPGARDVAAYSILRRVNGSDADEVESRQLLMKFQCSDGRLQIQTADLLR